MISAIFLDLDGTLIDSLEDICGHLNRVRQRVYGLPLRPTGELRPCIGHGVDYLIKHGCPELPASEHPRVVEAFRNSYLEDPYVGGAPYAGVAETLETLRRRPGLKVSVVTNKHTKVAELTLKHYLPTITFDHVAGADSVTRFKPHPAHLLEAARKVGIDPAKGGMVMVGDHEVDRQCAEAAGARFFAAGYGFGGVKGTPGQILNAFPELLAHLKLG